MKKIIVVFLLMCFNSYSQSKEKVIFLYENEKDTVIYNKNETIYKIDNKHTFKFTSGKHEKREVNYNSIKENLISYNEFIKQNKGKNHPELFNEYSFYIFIVEKDKTGCLIEIEKVWIVDETITD